MRYDGHIMNARASTSESRNDEAVVQQLTTPLSRTTGRGLAGGTLAIVLALVLSLMLIALPLRTYYGQRQELARTETTIAEEQTRKQELQEEIDKYSSPAYQEEQARRRLGVIEQGETPYRVLDPELHPDSTVTTPQRTEEVLSDRPWYQQLWDSVTSETNPQRVTVPLASTSSETDDEQTTPEQNTPTTR